MMDNSGSTKTTDPNKFYRVDTVNNFYQVYNAKQNFTYSYAWFSDAVNMVDPVTSKIVTSSSQPFGNADFLKFASSTFSKVAYGGGTNYLKAFSSLQSMVSNDMVAGSKWDYVIVFMSDGEPTDVTSDSQLTTVVNNLETQVKSKGHLLSVSTVYFGPAGSTSTTSTPTSADKAISRLKAMAAAGSGQFLDTNQTGGTLKIDDIITVPGQVCTYK
jgi:hypothetical protein